MSEIFEKPISPTPHLVKKFYFLDYFYILLKSVKNYSSQFEIFESFKILKKEYLLGESKYKKLSIDDETELSKKQLDKFFYTFEQVVSESLEYGLIEKEAHSQKLRALPPRRQSAKTKLQLERKKSIFLTEVGENALHKYEISKFDFNLFMLDLMEKKHHSFYELIKLCYSDNKLKNGLMIFPIYSGLKLGIEKSSFNTHGHVIDYSKALIRQFENDIKVYTNKNISLIEQEQILIGKLKSDNIIGENRNDKFDSSKYNATLSRFRKYWLNYFLKSIYNYPYSFSTFSLWIERAKQCGVLNTTEFFPDFSGRIVYPTSVILSNTKSKDFLNVFKYQTDECLFIHKPLWSEENNQDDFVKTLLDEYLIFQKIRKTHFVNLADLKERVCFRSRLPGFVFDEFLEKSYQLNLKGELRIQISLEADRLPQETNAMYLRREPILVNGKYKNIIAINYRRDNDE